MNKDNFEDFNNQITEKIKEQYQGIISDLGEAKITVSNVGISRPSWAWLNVANMIFFFRLEDGGFRPISGN